MSIPRTHSEAKRPLANENGTRPACLCEVLTNLKAPVPRSTSVSSLAVWPCHPHVAFVAFRASRTRHARRALEADHSCRTPVTARSIYVYAWRTRVALCAVGALVPSTSRQPGPTAIASSAPIPTATQGSLRTWRSTLACMQWGKSKFPRLGSAVCYIGFAQFAHQWRQAIRRGQHGPQVHASHPRQESLLDRVDRRCHPGRTVPAPRASPWALLGLACAGSAPQRAAAFCRGCACAADPAS